jgi:hypothetical protein
VPALADGESSNVSVDCTDIDVTDDSPAVGTTITFSGTVSITATADAGDTYPDNEFYPRANAGSKAWYEIYLDGVLLFDSRSDDPYYDGEIGDVQIGWFQDHDGPWVATASQDYEWDYTLLVDLVGEYTAEQFGEAYAYYGHWEYKGCYLHGYWDFVEEGGVYPEDPKECSKSVTATSHSGVVASMGYIHPYLVIELPDGSKHFFGKDGWGDPTSQDIVYTDGTWQVEIQDGTIIQLDGTWHKTTYLDVDDQGNVTGRYDAGGSTVAEEIGLSQPITITKVG